ncbi:hypothetical protein BG418_01490 [Streptomyces sp. CBMA152]|nr:hypothetical protein [Streptomyces sp. CBMA152]
MEAREADAPVRVNIASDVTEEKALKNGIEDLTCRYRKILAVTRDPLVLLDGKGVVQDSSGQFEKLIGMPRIKIAGTDLRNLLAPSSRAQLTDLLEAQAEGAEKAALLLFCPAGGGAVLSDIALSSMRTASDDVIHLIVVRSWGDPAEQLASRRATEISEIDARIIELLAIGASNAKIAENLCISRQGLDYRLKTIRKQLDAPSRSALIARAYARRIFEDGSWPPKIRRPGPVIEMP